MRTHLIARTQINLFMPAIIQVRWSSVPLQLPVSALASTADVSLAEQQPRGTSLHIHGYRIHRVFCL